MVLVRVVESQRVRHHTEFVVQATTDKEFLLPSAGQARPCVRLGTTWATSALRRYDDFKDLRVECAAASLGLEASNAATFPPAGFYVLHHAGFLSARRAGLDEWLRAVVKADPELRSPALRSFLGIPGVSVLGRAKEGSGSEEHVEYRISVSAPGFSQLEVSHRYTDFETLEAKLRGRYALPEFPPKGGVKQFFQSGFLEKRQAGLAAWLEALFAADLADTGLPSDPALTAFLGLDAPRAAPELTGLQRKLARWGWLSTATAAVDTQEVERKEEPKSEAEWRAVKRSREEAFFHALQAIQKAGHRDITMREKVDLATRKRQLISENTLARNKELRARRLQVATMKREVEQDHAKARRAAQLLAVKDMTQKARMEEKLKLDREEAEARLREQTVQGMEALLARDETAYALHETAALS